MDRVIPIAGRPGSDYGWVSDMLGIGLKIGEIAHPIVETLENIFG